MHLKVILLTLAVLVAIPSCTASRQQVVRQNGARVMPFSMEATMHNFEPTATGGVMTVIVHSRDAQQLALVRSHLRKEAAAFTRGDYADPSAIHGHSMPGIAELSAGAGRIDIRYAQRPSGARITFASKDAKLIAALHRWFHAQVADHGADAMMMHM